MDIPYENTVVVENREYEALATKPIITTNVKVEYNPWYYDFIFTIAQKRYGFSFHVETWRGKSRIKKEMKSISIKDHFSG